MMYMAVSVYWISVLLVPSVAQQMSARVVNGTADAGRLEILYDGTWGTVCGSVFGQREALVACRMLGFNSTTAVAVGSAKYGAGSGPILFSDLRCVGNETSLAQCQHSGLYISYCEHWQDVGVMCNITQQMSARVVGGTADAGRLELLYDGTWGTVCGKRFGNKAALVACRMLGFNRHDTNTYTTLGAILRRARDEKETLCNEVKATPMTARLHGGTSEAGRLEISVNGEWTTVCEGGFGESEVEVALRMLGLNSTGQAAVKSLLFNDGSRFRFGYINCQGMETSLQQCDIGQLNKSDCLDVGIIYDFKSFSLQLTGTRRTDSNMGRVEVEIRSKQFSTVCVNNEKTAAVICRQLNLTSNGAALVDGRVFGANTSPLLEAAFFCDGNENSLFECGWNESTKECYADDVGVVCSKDYTLYIVSETEKYPFMEGTKGVLMCVKPRKYIQVLEYTWSGKDDGPSRGNRLFYDNLTREYNGREISCEASNPDGASGPGERLRSGRFVLSVYCE
ncbi:scavenger receptor cysteine-rich domain superfamily protein-like [Pomacea canaliculata]|uniref:scavenger receptor cysteine-rich domain superfamily protein-like n=1 Tax=Pomacea canaliculata TaxID=400727 RepID=UPI000D738F4E|nr:scavenger receptor cysteine-rich domain superfamily protein-like [Pomacea canaliculata]